MTAQKWDAWNYRESAEAAGRQDDLTGFKVHATDGHIGKIDAATREVGGSYVVVDTGPWIFGRKVLLPAGVVRDIDLVSEMIFVDLTKDEIKNAPEFDEMTYREQSYRTEIGDYYRGRREVMSGERM